MVKNVVEIYDFLFDKYFVKKDLNRFDMYFFYVLYVLSEVI